MSNTTRCSAPGLVSGRPSGYFSLAFHPSRRWAPTAASPPSCSPSVHVHATFDPDDEDEDEATAPRTAAPGSAVPTAATAPRLARSRRRKVDVPALPPAHACATGPTSAGAELFATGGGGDQAWARPGRVHFAIGHRDRDYADPCGVTGVVTATEVDLLLANLPDWPDWPRSLARSDSTASGMLQHSPSDTDQPQRSDFQNQTGLQVSLVHAHGLAATTQMLAAFELTGADHVVGVLLIPGVGSRWSAFLRWWTTLDQAVRKRCIPRRALEGFASHLGRVTTTCSRALTDAELTALLENDSIPPIRALVGVNQIDGVRLHDDWRTGANDAVITVAAAAGVGTGQVQPQLQPRGFRKVCVFEISVPVIETIETTTSTALSGNPKRVTTAGSRVQHLAARLCRLWRFANWDPATPPPTTLAASSSRAAKDVGALARRAAGAPAGERKRRLNYGGAGGSGGSAPKSKRGRFLPPPTTAAQKARIASGGSHTVGVRGGVDGPSKSPSPSPFFVSPSKLSRTLSRILRHDARRRGIFIDPAGFVAVADLLRQPELRSTTLADLRATVTTCPKQRFGLERRRDGGWWIRANQGHSLTNIRAEELCTKITVTTAARYPSVVHGTTRAAWRSIRTAGLNRMQRQHVHFGSTGPGAGAGVRRSSQVLVYIDLDAALGAGIPFYVSANGVILSPGEGTTGTVPATYFARAVETSTGRTLL